MDKKKIISIVAAAVGAVCAILALVFYIKSFGHDDYGEWGKEFWANTDYIIFLICSAAVLIFGIYYLVKPETKNYFTNASYVLLFDGFMLASYSFGKFFRALAKGKGFDSWYFIFAMVGLVVLAASFAVKKLLANKD